MLRCPRCSAELTWADKYLACANGHDFPLVNGIAVLTLEEQSDVDARQHTHQSTYYDREYGTYQAYHLENWHRTYLRRLATVWEVCGPTAPFLDSGVGGSAYTIVEAARAGLPAVGCDLSVQGMVAARRLAEAEGVADRCLFVVCRAEQLPFADASFGGVASVAVLEHVPEDRKALAELARVTKPGGRIFLAVPNSIERLPRPLRRIYRWHDRRVGHLRHYSSTSLIERAKAVGLEPIKTAYSAHWIKVWQLALHLAAGRLRIPDDRLWWWMERRDGRQAERDSGMHLNLWLQRPG